MNSGSEAQHQSMGGSVRRSGYQPKQVAHAQTLRLFNCSWLPQLRSKAKNIYDP